MTRFGAHIYESGTTRLGGSEIILLVKDQPTVRELFQAMLCKDGYRVLAAPQTVDFGTIRRIFSTTKNQQVTASLVSGGVRFLGNVGIEAGMEAGLLDRVWSLEELVGLLEQKVVGLAAA
jgi:hypothetical protein